ncbi:MAG: helix-turn-helix transcriptional regulator [Kofleriaceae bacterium]
MASNDDRRRIRFWRPDSPSVAGMLRVEHEDRIRTTYSEQFVVVVVYEGAFDGWYRGAVRTHVAGAINLKEPGEVHRGVRIHVPFTIQGATFTSAMVAAAADALGLRGPVQFRSSGFGPGDRAAELGFAMHAALIRPDAPEIERATRVAEALTELLSDAARSDAADRKRAPRAIRRARAFLHDSLADKVTLDELARFAGLDKFHLVRAFRAEIGLPPYEYLTHARIAKAKQLLQRGGLVADVAQAVGFCDESQLHRHFRRIVGIPPGRFAKSFNRCDPANIAQSRRSGAGAC